MDMQKSEYLIFDFRISHFCLRHTIVVTGAIDNLIKGAAGQAVQNMNLMFGIDEECGLKSLPMSI